MSTVQSSFRLSESSTRLVVTRNWINVHTLAGVGFFILVGALFLWYAVAQLIQGAVVGALLGAGAALPFFVAGGAVVRAGQHRGPSRIVFDSERREVEVGGRVLPFAEVVRITTDVRLYESGHFGTDQHRSGAAAHVYLHTKGGEHFELGRSGNNATAQQLAARIIARCGLHKHGSEG